MRVNQAVVSAILGAVGPLATLIVGIKRARAKHNDATDLVTYESLVNEVRDLRATVKESLIEIEIRHRENLDLTTQLAAMSIDTIAIQERYAMLLARYADLVRSTGQTTDSHQSEQREP